MQNLDLTHAILYGIEPRFFNLFSDLVDITHRVIFEERPLNTSAPHEPLFNNPSNGHFTDNNRFLMYEITYIVGNLPDCECSLKIFYYKSKGTIVVMQDIGYNGSTIFRFTNDASTHFSNPEIMKGFWYHWLHVELDKIPLVEILRYSRAELQSFEQNCNFEIGQMPFLAQIVQRPSASHIHEVLQSPDMLRQIRESGLPPTFKNFRNL